MASPRWVISIKPNPRTQRAVRLLGSRPVDATAPKTFQNVLQLQRFIVATDRLGRLADAAAEAGDADQSHMTRQVRAMAGITPGRLVEERNSSARGERDA